MPERIQLKLLSNIGEILNLVTCHAGRVSVLRAATPSDLRPYQRALGGSSGKDFISIEVDGSEYQPEQHTLIGFGEPSPTTGLSVHDFLTNNGVSELAITPLLLSLGLEEAAAKRCSELTSDQEARLRVLAAINNPNKVVVLNDPFEHISGKWRERAAELISDFARTQRAIVVVPFLSYRPESWIDNETVERIEVGHTTQRTIGFGSRGSEADEVINQFRERSRSDRDSLASASSIAAGSSLANDSSSTAAQNSLELSRRDLASRAWGNFTTGLVKTVCVLAGAGFATWGAFSLGKLSTNEKVSTPNKAADVSSVAANKTGAKAGAQNPTAVEVANSGSNLQNNQLATTTKVKQDPTPPEKFILDLYPVAIKNSILDTARGTRSYQAPATEKPASQPQPPGADQGNLFSLLAKAGSDQNAPNSRLANSNDVNDRSYADEEPQSDQEISDEEQRREEIRQRFLEAIRASAERRRMEAEELENQ